jgi:hypothetical protein
MSYPSSTIFGRIAMVSSSLFTEIKGQCKIDTEMEGYTYSNTVMLIMKVFAQML